MMDTYSLARKLAKELGVPNREAMALLSTVTFVLVDGLVRDGAVRLFGLGQLTAHHRTKNVRDRTGESRQTEEIRVSFKKSDALKRRLRRKD